MARPTRTNRWLNAWRECRRHTADFGDHGTAFGLDLSLSQFPETSPPAAATATATAIATAAPIEAPRRGWLARIRRRDTLRSA